MSHTILVIDQGTTSTRAMVFNHGKIMAVAQQEFSQHFPHTGWVEHDATDIWQSVKACMAQVCEQTFDISAIGITNQRETVVAWDKTTGEPITRAIVWQDRRTADYCEQLKQQGHEAAVKAKTGLLLDPYFSASKIRWILDNCAEAASLLAEDKLRVGTIDSWLLWKLTDGKAHKTDASNASRTMLYNIHTGEWDDELLALFSIPRSILPEVCDNAHLFGTTNQIVTEGGSAVPITAMIGDQQSALVGQACFRDGMVKSTYGTGCFMVANTGPKCLQSQNKLLSTIAYQLNGQVTYALEGSIFMAGATVQWLRDKMGFVEHAKDTEAIAERCPDTKGVYLVPAFTGMGAPYWRAHAKAALVGMTRDTGRDEIVTAALQSVAFQTDDLLGAMQRDGVTVDVLRVDGGMVLNNWLLKFLADILNTQVDRPEIIETTALGAAYLAGLHIGEYRDLADIATHWRKQYDFHPSLPAEKRDELIKGWHQAVATILQ